MADTSNIVSLASIGTSVSQLSNLIGKEIDNGKSASADIRKHIEAKRDSALRSIDSMIDALQKRREETNNLFNDLAQAIGDEMDSRAENLGALLGDDRKAAE